MLVSKKHESLAPQSFTELVGQRHKVPNIDWEAIFYTYASAESEFLGVDDYVDETGVILWNK